MFENLQRSIELCKPSINTSANEQILFVDALKAVAYITRDYPSWDDGASVLFLRTSILDTHSQLNVIRQLVSPTVADYIRNLTEIRYKGKYIRDLKYDLDMYIESYYDHFMEQDIKVQTLEAYQIMIRLDQWILKYHNDLTKDEVILNSVVLESMIKLKSRYPTLYEECQIKIDRAKVCYYTNPARLREISLN